MAEGGSGGGSDEEVIVKFGAAIGEIQEAISKVTELFSGLAEKIAGVTAVLGGGDLFGDFVEQANRAVEQTDKLSRMMGTSAQDAATLSTALSGIGQTTETYESAFGRFNQNMRHNSEAMKALGVDTESVKNGTRSSADVFAESINILSQYKPGIDQTQVSMQLFGRRVGDVTELLRLTNEVTYATAARLGTTKEALDESLTPAQKFAENMKTAAAENMELGLSVDSGQVEAFHRFQESLSGVADVGHGMAKTFGQELIPSLTLTAEKFATFGPQLVAATKVLADAVVRIAQVMKDALFGVWNGAIEPVIHLIQQAMGDSRESTIKWGDVFELVCQTIVSLFIGVRTTVLLVATAIGTAIDVLAKRMEIAQAIIGDLAHGQFKTAIAAYNEGMNEINHILDKGWAKAVEITTKANADIHDATTTAAQKAAIADENYDHEGRSRANAKDGNKSAPDPNAAKAAEALAKAVSAAKIQALKDQLKIDEDANAEDVKSLDEAYKRKTITIEAYFSRLRELKLAALQLKIDETGGEVKSVQSQRPSDAPGRVEQASKVASLESQIRLFKQQQAELQAKITQETKDAADAQTKTMTKEDSGKSEKMLEEAIKAATAEGEGEVKAHRLTQEELTKMEEKWQEDLYALKKQNLENERATLGAADIVGKQKIDDQLLILEMQNDAKLAEIRRKSMLEMNKDGLNSAKSIQGDFTTMFSGIINGTEKVHGAFNKFQLSVRKMFGDLIAQKFAEKLFGVDSGFGKAITAAVTAVEQGIGQMITSFISGETAKSAAQMSGDDFRVAHATAAAAETDSVTATSALGQIAKNAWVAASGVYAAIASIPYVGPFLAPAMAIAAGAAVLGYAGKIAHAEGGWWQVPGDRITNIHKDEMVLPAEHAAGLRQMITGGGGGGGGIVHIHGSPDDGIKLKDLASAMKAMNRKFAFVGH